MPPKEDCRPSVGLPEEKRGVVRGAASPSYVLSIRLPAGPEALQMHSGSSDMKWSWEFEGADTTRTAVRRAIPGIRLTRHSTKSISRSSDKGAIGSFSGTSVGSPALRLHGLRIVTWLVAPIQ